MTAAISSYELIGRLARGGMAEVFLARQRGPQGFSRLVVVKRILPASARSAASIRRFVDEAKIMAALDHPHIAQVHELGMLDGQWFLAMEYVHGQDLHAIHKRVSRLGRTFSIELVVAVGRCIASALHHAHQRRGVDGKLLEIVHRDVSPENILISYDGVVKLVDFGIAKAAANTSKTSVGLVKGKLAYMSPEQAQGEIVDHRTDVFSLGIVLWELVTRQWLFQRESAPLTLQAVLDTDTFPPSRVRSDCPVELDRIILKALATEKAVRYQTAEQLEIELEDFARATRLRQSAIGLRGYMHQLFAAEIVSWADVQIGGYTATDQITDLLSVEPRTPDPDVESDDVEDADDEETLARAPIDPDEVGDYTQVEAFGEIDRAEEITTAVPTAPPVILGQIDATPPPILVQPPYAPPLAHASWAAYPPPLDDWRPHQTAQVPVPRPPRVPVLAIIVLFVVLFAIAIVLAIFLPGDA